jgi:hypothetical protein
MFRVKLTENSGKGPSGFVRLFVLCLTLMTLKPKPSRLLEISSAGVSSGR